MESRYLVSARKYRPQTFGELVGQEHVADTLRNAIRLDRLAHAYLFSGPRGVGKTTAARVLAKAINCETPLADRPEAEPCRTCASCRSFEEGRSMTIIEIDAASNNKVDDIRDLRDTVRVPPQGARRKVYIVDEVHMLSTSAFNALLKTLEEPPPYVLFIFATTEPHKVLPTILSRCQRFDFRRIAVDEIIGHLRAICAEEGITADDGALLLIARKGDGALRDALSAFDQAVALCGDDLRYAALARALGVVETDHYFAVTDAVRARDAAGLLTLVDGLVRRGYDVQEFLGGLQEHLRNLLVARTLPDLSLIEAAEATRARYGEAAGAYDEADLLRLLALVADAEDALRSATQPRLRLELTLLKMAALATAHDLTAALRAVERLEGLAREGRLPAAEAPEPRPAPPRAATPPPPSAGGGGVAARPLPVPAPAADAVFPTPALRRVPTPGAPAPDDAATPTAPAERPPPRYEAPPAEAVREPAGPPPSTPDAPDADGPPRAAPPPEAPARPRSDAGPAERPDLALFSTPALRPRRGDAPRPPSGDGGPAALAAVAEPLVAVAEADGRPLAEARRAWTDAAATLRPRFAAIAADALPLGFDADALVVAVPTAFAAQELGEVEDDLLGALRAPLGGAVRRLRLLVRPPHAASADGSAPAEDPLGRFKRALREHDTVRLITDTFGCEPIV